MGVARETSATAARRTLPQKLLARIRQNEERLFLALTLVIGVVVGLTIVAFVLLTERVGLRLYPVGGQPWRRLIMPVLGSVLTGYLLYRYFPNARGSGIPQTKTALFVGGGRITLRTVFGKFLCSSTSLASGIALGREGPSVHIGAGIASVLGRALRLSPEALSFGTLPTSSAPRSATRPLAAQAQPSFAGTLHLPQQPERTVGTLASEFRSSTSSGDRINYYEHSRS